MMSRMNLFVFLLLLAGMSLAQEKTAAVIQEPKEYTIEKCLNRFSGEQAIKTSVGYQYWFIPRNFLSDGLTVKMSVVGPNQATHDPHRHSEPEIFFILEGTARFFLDGQTTTCPAYGSFFCPGNSEHGISNADTTVLKYLVIRKYPVE